MIPKFRAWDTTNKEMFKDTFAITESGQVVTVEQGFVTDTPEYVFVDNLVVMQSTGLVDKNGMEIFEGDILKFNDEWNDYCYEGYVDGTIEGINFVEIERETTCFTFGKFQTSESSLLYFMRDEYLSFKDLITDKKFEFEIVGNVYENPELLEVTE